MENKKIIDDIMYVCVFACGVVQGGIGCTSTQLVYTIPYIQQPDPCAIAM